MEMCASLKVPFDSRTVTDHKNLIKMLKSFKIFRPLNFQTIGELTSKIKMATLNANSLICKEDAIAYRCFILIKGKIDVYRDDIVVATIE